MSDDPEDGAPPNAGDRRAQARARRAAERREREEGEFWRAVLADPVGRRALWGVLERCHAFEERFGCGPNGTPQPEASWLYAGEQRAGFGLYLDWLKHNPEGVLLMLQEHDPRLQPAALPRRARSETTES